MDFLLYIFVGATVGLAIGITGVGGGSLMTPILLLFGFPPHVAVGTDLLYAGITKTGGALAHQRLKTINWRLVSLMAMGSLPTAAITIYSLQFFFSDPESYQKLLTSTLGIMLVLTSLVILFKTHFRLAPASYPLSSNNNSLDNEPVFSKQKLVITVVAGIVLGVLVTLSSVGAGAIAAAVLMLLYPALPSLKIIGTDLAHAVPLTLFAGLGHMWLGNVDFLLLACLLVGSLPAVAFGTQIGRKMPERTLQTVLASCLMLIGAKYTFF